MSLRCLFGRHRPSLTTIMRRPYGYSALCDGCGMPIERSDEGRWIASEPLIAKADQAP